jgi:excisionase family DNA binding protein
MSDLPAPAPDPVLLAAEVCKELRCSLNKFYQLVATGELVARKFGKRTVVLRSDLEAFKAAWPRLDLANAEHKPKCRNSDPNRWRRVAGATA